MNAFEINMIVNPWIFLLFLTLVSSRRASQTHQLGDMKLLDEDVIDVLSRFEGDVEITDSLATHVKVAVERMLGLRAKSPRKAKPNRVRTLLELSAEITKVSNAIFLAVSNLKFVWKSGRET